MGALSQMLTAGGTPAAPTGAAPNTGQTKPGMTPAVDDLHKKLTSVQQTPAGTPPPPIMEPIPVPKSSSEILNNYLARFLQDQHGENRKKEY